MSLVSRFVKTPITKNNQQPRSAGARKPRKQRSNKRPARAGKTSSGRGSRMVKTHINRPIVQGVTIQNTSREQVMRITGQEIVGRFDFLNDADYANLGTFPVGEYDLSPMAYPGTRMNTLASAFQKYRFTNKTKFLIQTQAPTISTGNYLAGYTENPDQAMGESRAATNNISNLSGAISSPVWQSTEVPVKINDRSKWYNVDADTEEIMMAIQGKFVFQQSSPVSVLGSNVTTLFAPIWLHYEIEFIGNASQTGDDGTIETEKQLPPGVFEAPTGTGDALFNGRGLKFTNATGLTNTLGPDVLYELTPGIEVAGGESANYVWTYTFGSSGGYLLAATEDDAMAGIYLTNQEACGTDNYVTCPGCVGIPLWFGKPIHFNRTAPTLSVDLKNFVSRSARPTKSDRALTSLRREFEKLKLKVSKSIPTPTRTTEWVDEDGVMVEKPIRPNSGSGYVTLTDAEMEQFRRNRLNAQVPAPDRYIVRV